jgi:hypothetical protein
MLPLHFGLRAAGVRTELESSLLRSDVLAHCSGCTCICRAGSVLRTDGARDMRVMSLATCRSVFRRRSEYDRVHDGRGPEQVLRVALVEAPAELNEDAVNLLHLVVNVSGRVEVESGRTQASSLTKRRWRDAARGQAVEAPGGKSSLIPTVGGLQSWTLRSQTGVAVLSQRAAAGKDCTTL